MFIFWSPTKIHKDERPHVAVCLHVCIFICTHTHILQLYLYTVTTVMMTMCHMMICGAKLLRYSLVVLAHVCWCLPKEIPGRFRVSTVRDDSLDAVILGVGLWGGGISGTTSVRMVATNPVLPRCPASGPENSACPILFTGAEPNLACLSKSRIKRGLKSSAEKTNAATLYYHQLYCNSLWEQW